MLILQILLTSCHSYNAIKAAVELDTLPSCETEDTSQKPRSTCRVTFWLSSRIRPSADAILPPLLQNLTSSILHLGVSLPYSTSFIHASFMPATSYFPSSTKGISCSTVLLCTLATLAPKPN